VAIAGKPFQHLLYHFVMACSRWEHVGVVLGGESFTALAENLRAKPSGRWAACRKTTAPTASRPHSAT
jgi:hypothetical protein